MERIRLKRYGQRKSVFPSEQLKRGLKLTERGERMLTPKRRADPSQTIELVRWQVVLHGWFGYRLQMILNRRAPTLFLRRVWVEK
jgi:hypothetical protein